MDPGPNPLDSINSTNANRIMGHLAEHRPFDYYDDYGYYDNYTYDYNLTDGYIPLEDALFTLPYALTFIIGVIGNVLVLFSIAYYRRMRTTTNVFLFSMASADLLLIVICVPIKAARFVTFSWEFGEVLCKTVFYVQNVSMICSVFTLSCISLERVVAVAFPLKARYLCTTRRAQILVLVVWMLAFWFAIPIIFIQTHLEVGVRNPAFWCQKNYSYPVGIAFEVGMLLLMFVFPMSIMTASYIIICRRIWNVSSMRADMRSGRVIAPVSRQRVYGNNRGVESSLLTSSGDHSGVQSASHKHEANQDKQTTVQLIVMLVVVVLLFAICWGPVLIDNVLIACRVVHHLNYGHLKPMRRTIHLLSYVNSCVNPIVYAFMSKNFRQSFKFAICGCMKGQAFVRAYRFSMSLAQTRTSVLSVNGRNKTVAQHPLHHRREKSTSSENEYTQAPTASPEEMELSAMANGL